ncbi:MAG: endo-1,4-beta-xylanase [Prevotellaceae bacterium]|nr:endo-1,4-beta-xylanase [Candidatus Colivivens equi]
MKKQLLLLALLSFVVTSAVAQEKFELGKPNNDNYRYLDDYQALKEYINRDKYPNFKLGSGTTVSSYLNETTFRNMINKNFNETVAGNAMKMASCVDGNGNMNFSTVTQYVNAATKAGLSVYGHTLAWHSQQPNGWLYKLIADRPAPDLTDGDVDVYVQKYSKDFRTNQNVGWTADKTQYGFTLSFDATDGLHIHTTKTNNSWEVQFVAADNINLETGKTYKMTMTIKGTKSGKMHTKLGDWGSGTTHDIPFSTTWKDVEMNYKAVLAGNFLLLQCGEFVGDIYIRNIKFEEKKKGRTINEERRCLKVESTARQTDVWDNQMWFMLGSFPANAKYELKAEVRADKPAYASTQIHTSPGTYVHYEALGNINFTTEWKTINLSGTLSKAGESIALNLSELADANNYYLDNVSFKINGVERIKNGDFEGQGTSSFRVKTYGGGISTPTICTNLTYIYVPSSIPLTQQERHDTLVYAMDKWIKGMMQACGGKVKGWDLVNEAISGGGNDGSGNYTLQHSQGYSPGGTWDVGGDAFYWQDYMGDLEYVRQACRLARKYGPADIKLFINDYNLESDWDNNKKLKSLINWIKKWEADGVTYIDGIGTQMHISFYKNSSTQNSKKSAITNMFKLMAATGKYVRVSEMDMGYVDANGNDVPTGNMTESQHKEMANYYEWIIKQYLSIIPPSQQWGICQWCPTDAPSNSGWRANTPVGIWDINYYRKHVYAGFVRGLGGIPADIDNVNDDNRFNNNDNVNDNSFNVNVNLNGVRVNENYKGIIIKNGKKIFRR